MPEPLKNLINNEFFEYLNSVLLQTVENFDEKQFMSLVYDETWQNRELKDRTKHIALALKTTLNNTYPNNVKTLLNVLNIVKQKKITSSGIGFLFFPEFIELFGLDHYEISVKAMEEITQLMSCEFAVRQYIIKYPHKMMEQMLLWSKHPNFHVRRLSSEGCRPRLPWAVALQELKKDPAPILPILENLKDDEVEFVRKSVANNINDISKDNPKVVLELITRWKGTSPNVDWIIKHGCRTLLKNADEKTYKFFGLIDNSNCTIENFRIEKETLKIGDKLPFGFKVKNPGNEEEKLRLEYAIYYKKSNGKQNRKLFKIAENTLKPKESLNYKREQSFMDFTTRKHYLGEHKISVVLNGKETEALTFNLIG
ncbi:MAG: DNA alkylation repair protein [bacterium]